MTIRALTKSARRNWKVLLVLAILFQLFLMYRTLPDGDQTKVVLLRNSDLADLQEKVVDKVPTCPKPPVGNCPNMIYIQSGFRNSVLPLFCRNSQDVWGTSTFFVQNLSQAETHRGVHAVVLDAQYPSAVVAKNVFDTYVSDEDFVNFLFAMRFGDVLLLASFDDMGVHLSAGARMILSQHFGGSLINDVGMRDHFVMVGQKGISKGHAFENLVHRQTTEDYPSQLATISVCVTLPIGQLFPLPPDTVLKSLTDSARTGIMSNCGLEAACLAGYSVPVYVSTGIENAVGPALCVNSQLIFHPLIGFGGRGYNLAHYDPLSQSIVTRSNFDPYAEDFNRLDIFLENIREQHLLFGVVHDDGSQRVPNLTEFGISMVLELQFRSVGFFVGQRASVKAIESVSHPAEYQQYAPPVQFRGCIPRQITGLQLASTPIEESKIDNRFCGVNGDIVDPFCQRQRRTDNWLFDRKVDDQLDFPIIIMAGNDVFSLERTLDSIANQARILINGQNVTVFASTNSLEFEEAREMVKSYGYVFDSCECESFDGLFEAALNRGEKLSQLHGAFIFVEPDVVLSPDFIAISSKAMSIINKDPSSSLTGVSGFNHNGYHHLPFDQTDVFLSDSALPSPCFIAKHNFTKNLVLSRKYKPWPSLLNFIILDQSRCFKTPPMLTATSKPDAKQEIEALFHLFHQPRRSSLVAMDDSDILILFEKISKLATTDDYDRYLLSVPDSSRSIDYLELCKICSNKHPGQQLDGIVDKTTITVKLDSKNSLETVANCCRIFALFHGYGMYKSTFHLKGVANDYLLVRDSSS